MAIVQEYGINFSPVFKLSISIFNEV